MDEFEALLPCVGAWGSIAITTVKHRAVVQTDDPEAVGLADSILRAQSYADGHALQLGPDEWLLLDCNDVAVLAPHSHVDVTDRQIGLSVSGPQIGEILATGVALDLDPRAFPVGMVTRTLLGKAEIILWRTADDHWHIEVWRSYAPYVLRYLNQAIIDLPDR
jgi:sarcosine oxidase, subunit gamma